MLLGVGPGGHQCAERGREGRLEGSLISLLMLCDTNGILLSNRRLYSRATPVGCLVAMMVKTLRGRAVVAGGFGRLCLGDRRVRPPHFVHRIV